jgi:hypothetical protein
MENTIIDKDERKALSEAGYSNSDILQIAAAVKKTKYYLVTPDNKRHSITESEAIERLGREEWLRGIARSTFYIDTTRYGLNDERIAMHSKVYA